jgi:hypothetical protein
MLWLAGLMGMMAVGAVTFIDSGIQSDPDDANTPASSTDQDDILSGTVGEDALDGGAGDDQIIAGQNDIVTTGTGNDTVVLGDWITEGHTAQIMDFNCEEDNILLVWDDANGEEPTVDLQPNPTNPNLIQILMNGTAVADVDAGSDIELSDIVLIAQSLAQTGVIANV